MLKRTHRFRLEVLRGAFEEAERTLEDVRAEVDAAWKQAETQEAREEIAETVTKLLQWARQTVLASRAHTQHKLVLLNREKAYLRGY
jgi:hypothetical protein